MADDVTLQPVSPFYRIRFHDGSFDCTGDPGAMRAEVARLSPGDVDGYERFMRLSETTCRIGFEQLGDVPFGSWTDMVAGRTGPAPAWRLSQRSRPGQPLHQGRAAAYRVQLSSAADRRQSVHRQRHLHADPVSGAALGRAFRHGGDRRGRARSGRSDRGPGRHDRATTPRSSRSLSAGTRQRRTADFR